MSDAPDQEFVGSTGLSPEDARALDALIDAGLDPEAVAEALRPRAERVGRLLGLLESPIGTEPQDEARQRRIDTAMHAIEASARPAGRSVNEAMLGLDDQDAVDALVMNRYRPGRVPARSKERAARAAAIGEMITGAEPGAWVAEGRDDRLGAAMAAIEASSESDRIPIDGPGSRRGLGFRLTDLVAVAAVLLLGASVLMPILGGLRTGQVQAACFGRLGQTAAGLGVYTSDFRDELPMATAGFGPSWMRVGEPGQSNSANLYTVVRTEHLDLETLACPGNGTARVRPVAATAQDWSSLDEISYSYQILPGSSRPTYALPSGSVVLTDRSPVILRAARSEWIRPEENSPNHAGPDGEGRGQHMLRLDGSVEWAESPILDGGDNLWLPRGVEVRIYQLRTQVGIEGTEMPESAEDAFVGP